MSRRKPPRPTADWRDPAMPIHRGYRFADGTVAETVTPEYETAFRKHMIEAAPQPDWRNDPTYNLRREK